MTNNLATDPFESEVRAAFRRHLATLDPLIPTNFGQPEIDRPAPDRVAAAPRVRRGRSLRSGTAGLGAAAGLVLVALIASGLLLRGTRPAVASPSPLVPASGAPTGQATVLSPRVVASFGSDDLQSAVLSPDGAAYVIDSTVSTVYWLSLQTGAKLPILRAGMELAGSVVGNPRVLATGGQDVLILDDANSLWRWRPADTDKTGRGALVKLAIPDSVNWGSGVRALGTFIINAQLGMYNLYVVVPSAGQILKYPPAADGNSFPTAGRANWLAVSQDLSTIDDMYVDGHIFLVDRGKITRHSLGQADSWAPALPAGSAAEPNAPYYTHLAADDPSQDRGTFYAYDRNNKQVVAIRKADGSSIGTYGASAALNDLRAMFVVTAEDGSASLYWLNGGELLAAPIRHAGGVPTASPSPSVGSEPSVVASFGTDELSQAALGPDRASAYVIDTTVNKIYRVDLETGVKVALDVSPDNPSAPPVGRPRLLGSLNYLLIVDSNNRFWVGPTGNRDKAGSLSVSQLTFDAPPSFSWGTGVRSVCVVSGHPADDSEAGAFDYYVASPAGVEVIKYAPVTAGQTVALHMTHGFDVNQQSAPIDDMYVYSQSVDPLRSGIFLVQGGEISLYQSGKPAPQWTFSRPISSSEQAPYYTVVAGDDLGALFAYDRANKQVAVFSGADGSYVRAALSSPALDGLSSMFVATGMDQARTLYWITGGKLMGALISGGSGGAP